MKNKRQLRNSSDSQDFRSLPELQQVTLEQLAATKVNGAGCTKVYEDENVIIFECK